MDGAQVFDEVRSDFIEKMGLVAQGEGLPRGAGRVFALLVFDGEAIAFGDLAETLQISRASISTAVRLLEERGLVKRVARPGDRQDYFQVAPDAFATMLGSTGARVRKARAEIDATIAALPDADDGPRARLTEYSRFYGAISDGLLVAMDRLQDKKATTR